MAIELWARGFSILLHDSRRTRSGRILHPPTSRLVGEGSQEAAETPTGAKFKAAVTRVLLEVDSQVIVAC